MAQMKAERKWQQEGCAPFLTSWDPSDLPGGSIDPLGFDRGYNALADKILPGLTNVAAVPRYLGLLCAGAGLGPEPSVADRQAILQRQESVVRLERLWALAHVLGAEDGGASASGIRGVTYAEAQRRALQREGARSTRADFTLLSRQVQYGAIGIYGNVAHGMRLIDRKTLGLTDDFGERLGTAFLDETGAPKSLLSAVKNPEEEVGIDVLRAWGRRAHLAAPCGPIEATVIGEALQLDTVRARMASALNVRPPQAGESELQRLNRIEAYLGKSDQDLAEAIEAVLAYEKCYAWALLVFERILWSCSHAGAVSLKDLGSDEHLQRCARAVPGAVTRLGRALEGTSALDLTKDQDRFKDVRAFLTELGTCQSGSGMVETVLHRHADVQHGKFDRGRRKLPWVEVVKGCATLTQVRANQIGREPTRATDIAPHEYRTHSADALIKASRGLK